MITTISGGLGSGKSTMEAILGYKAYRGGRNVYSDFKLNFSFKRISFVEIMKFELSNAVVILDEGYRYADSHHRSKLTTLFTYFVQQTRKRHVDFITASQRIMNIDIRIRDLAELRIFCEALPNSKHPQHLRYTFLEVGTGKITQIAYPMKALQKAFSLFNTDEYYDIFEEAKEKDKIRQMIRAIS